jgi:DNA-binding NarL/FixJ family response regulator
MITVALVDDHTILRKSLAVLVEMQEGYKVVLEADNGDHFKQLLKTNPAPDIVLLDITMPVMGGVDTAKWLREDHPEVKILALTMVKNEMVVIRMLKYGARGYLLKDCETAELRNALREVIEAGYYYNDILTAKMVRRGPDADLPELNNQELGFLRWACTDMTHKEIAAEMQVSPRTVDGYRDSLFRKLNVSSRVGIAIYAIKNGFVQI